MSETPERVLAEFESERAARTLMTIMAGEVGATYDALRDEYRYELHGHKRRLAMREDDGHRKTVVFIQEIPDGAAVP